MQPVLFRELCERLERHGVHVGVRDGLRIRTVLAARREWTLDAVRNCLRALLAHGPDQRRCFEREFDRFIVEIATGSPIQSQPLESLLDVLKSVNEDQPHAVRERTETPDDAGRASQRTMTRPFRRNLLIPASA